MFDAFEAYKIALENWRFQVNSYWTRNSYFAAFETALTFGVWQISERHSWLGAGFGLLGVTLSVAWFLNSDRLHEYITFYWERSIELERQVLLASSSKGEDLSQRLFLVSGFDAWRAERLHHAPRLRIRYSSLVQCVPLLFMIAWAMIIAFNVHQLTAHR
jgi:hypothetical protein